MRAILILSIVPMVAALSAPVLSSSDRHQLVVTGMGRVEVTPDLAQVTVGVQVQRPGADEALAEASRRTEAVVQRLLGLGVRRADVRTVGLNLEPVFVSGRITGYRASILTSARIRNPMLAGRAIDAAVEAGANLVQGVVFGLADPSQARLRALDRAIHDAQEKATAIAASAGLELRGIDRIVEGGVEGPAALRAASGAVEPGLVTVTAQVTVVFRISGL
jgi:uncharacterized protein YggE